VQAPGVADVRGLFVMSGSQPPAVTAGPPSSPGEPLRGTAVRIVLFFILAVLLGLPVAFLGVPGLWGSHLPILVGSLLAGWALLAWEGRGPGALGFPPGRGAWVESGLGLAAGTGLLLGAVLVMTLSGGIRWASGDGGGGGSALMGPLVVLAMLLIPAAGEEAFLRGYVFQASAERWGWGWTLGWTSGAFALLHVGNPGIGLLALVNLTLAGVVLGLVVLRTGSLWWATGAHLGWNWGQAALGLPVSGLNLLADPLLAPDLVGPGWRGGGEFGVEGALASTLVLSASGVWLWQGGGRRWIVPRPEVLAAGSPTLAGEAGATLARKGLWPRA
jgi:uncharacterized protein